MEKVSKALLVVTFFFTACVSENRKESISEEQFEKVREVNGKQLLLKKSLQFKDILLSKNHFIGQTLDPKNSFYIFSWPGVDSVYAFGGEGKGPGEYNFPLLTSYKGNAFDFCILDQGKKSLEYIDINSQSQNLDPIEVKGIPWDVYDVSQSMYIDSSVIYQILYTFRPDSLKFVATQVDKPQSGETIYSLANSEEDFDFLNPPLAVFDIWNNKVVIAYTSIPRFDILNISNEPYPMVNAVFSHSSQSFTVKVNNKGVIDFPNTALYYEGACAARKYIFLLYRGFSNAEAEQNIDTIRSEIHIYNWEGNPIEKLILDRYINLFSVDETRKVILGHDPRVDQPLFLFDY